MCVCGLGVRVCVWGVVCVWCVRVWCVCDVVCVWCVCVWCVFGCGRVCGWVRGFNLCVCVCVWCRRVCVGGL